MDEFPVLSDSQSEDVPPRWHRMSDRNRSLMARLFVGTSTSAIAAEFGISRVRVLQLAMKYEVIRLRWIAITPEQFAGCPCGLSYPRHRLEAVAHRRSAEHFWRLVDKSEGCWEWQGYRLPSGYGKIGNEGTHRRAWRLSKGPIPQGLWVLHHCDNPPCTKTEPDEQYPEGHLFLGTPTDNARDRDAKGRGRKAA